MLPKILYNFEKTKSYKNNTFVVVGWKSNHRLTTWQISDKSALLNFKINFVAFLKNKTKKTQIIADSETTSVEITA